MQVGDLVRFRRQPDPATGVIVDIDKLGRLGIAWSFLDGRIGWQSRQDVEVIGPAS
jgi:hypothetical protein